MWRNCIYIVMCIVQVHSQVSSPISPRSNYSHSIELISNISNLWWTVNETSREIIFELHVRTTGWIALGISPAGGMAGADIGVGWVDGSGRVFFQDRFATGNSLPQVDTTSTDWFALSGREYNGWTAIQFKRLLDTCDSMDVAIPYGTNRLIYAYGLVDPFVTSTSDDITYHEGRRGSKILSLRAYNAPPLASKFSSMDSFEFRLSNYTVPAQDTTYYCQVFKAPSNYTTKRHVIAHQMLISEATKDMVHHLLLYECNPRSRFDDSNLPRGECDTLGLAAALCTTNIAIGWAVGGQLIEEFPSVAGYPIGGNSTVKYYLIQMHYDNPSLISSRVDSSGLRFFVTETLRPNDLGFLTFGTPADAPALSIPPGTSNFVVDAFCPSAVSQKHFPSTGLTLFSAFPHTHLQGTQVWTKVIRNQTAVDYLFKAESYDFNAQINHHLPQPIQLYPGDSFLTRCIYNTKNKSSVTLGGESTRNEMCLHMFAYYPRIEQFYICVSTIPLVFWRQYLNKSELTETTFTSFMTNLTWTPDLIAQWQDIYQTSPRAVIYDTMAWNVSFTTLPNYNDLQEHRCTSIIASSARAEWNPSIIVLLFAQTILFFIGKANLLFYP